MINPNDINSIAYNLEDILEVNYVDPKLIEKLSDRQRKFLTVLMYQWTLGSRQTINDPEKIIKEMLDRVKPSKKYGNYGTAQYNKLNK